MPVPVNAPRRTALRADALLLLAATIWGFAFVAQRVGMRFVGPFTFNGIRFLLGALVLLPVIPLMSRRLSRSKGVEPSISASSGTASFRPLVFGSFLAGAFLFLGATFQQVGIVTTSAGNAGFITGLYVVIVPLLGLSLGQRVRFGTAIGAALAIVGMYLLSVRSDLTMGSGDLLVLVGAFCFAGHVLAIGWLSPRMDTLRLAVGQYLVCGGLSLVIAVVWETMTLDGVGRALIPILYGGIASVAIAYTLQILAQRSAPAAHAAIILSLEAVFAVIGGWLLLGEVVPLRGLAGCALMLMGMLVSQLWGVARTPLRGPRPVEDP